MTISTTDTPVLDLLASMTADSIEASSLDPETLVLVRIAALAAVDAPAVSYLLNLGAASDIGVEPDQIRGVLAAVAPIVGTARIASATGRSGRPSTWPSRSPSSRRRKRRTKKTGRGTTGHRHVAFEAASHCICRLRGLPRRRHVVSVGCALRGSDVLRAGWLKITSPRSGDDGLCADGRFRGWEG